MDGEVLNGQLFDNEVVLKINGRYIKPIMMEQNIENLKSFIQTKVDLTAFGITRYRIVQDSPRSFNIVLL
jgi:hypothetical protein